MRNLNPHGMTDFEIAKRCEIASLIAAGHYSAAKAVSIKFLSIKDRGRKRKRIGMLQTVKFWVTAMNTREIVKNKVHE
jgi:hypothetical protein